ncbi:hypothetical protein EV361DRAFT_795172 [Lentinula raphanica]|nr:hypothetical protein F5880DRAFT_1493810 [Lentinula raphanica]KAJ3966493.1 hypothetical protein EV361DRAFT_808980 [Lentinula raphanica]KAJ3973998.1 hypothetical protein EV361DRAFT_795172 [Lentinula raphanica]
MWGNSHFSSRIERTWPEVGSQFARGWRAFFLRLERLHGLQRNNPHHLWLLHLLFLPSINDDCQEFMEMWNSHPISGKGHDKSPNDMRLMGQLRNGLYRDVDNTIHPEILRYYGAEGVEDTEEARKLVTDHIRKEQSTNYYHAPVSVPKHRSPFLDQSREADLFGRIMEGLERSNWIPVDYFLTEDEWGDDGYPSFEVIPYGKRGHRELQIPLPHHIWFPRALQWARSLHTMDYILDSRAN